MGLPDRHRHVRAAVALLGLGLASARPAAAEPAIATGPIADPEAEQRRALEHGLVAEEPKAQHEQDTPDDGTGVGGGLRGTFGRGFVERSDDAWFGRLEFEGFGSQRLGAQGFVAGALIGGEYWRSDAGAGGGLPMSFWFGHRTPVLFTSMGLGFEMFIVDEVDDDGGFGIYAPFATANVGIELGGFRLLADARAIYRWQWGADDRAHLQLGIAVSQFLESRRPPRVVEEKR